MREKLQELMAREKLKPSQLAEKLEINPAGISHIIAGRNNPSFDLLQKILRKFPRVNPDWLLLDSGPIYRDEIPASTQNPAVGTGNVANSATNSSGENRPNESKTIPELSNSQDLLSASETLNPEIDRTVGSLSTLANRRSESGKQPAVLRIVIFYDDLSFETFTPKKN